MKKFLRILLISGFIIFLFISHIFDLHSGQEIGINFTNFLKTLFGIVPPTFVLISLFEVWIKRETVEKHLGDKSPVKGIIWAIILAGTIVGGLYVAFPVATVLYRKGARADVIFTFLFAATICRIPMTLFEANFVGVKFTLIRFFVSLPLVVLCSVVLGKIAEKYGMMKYLAKEK